MLEPSRRTSRLAIAGVATAALALVAGGFVLGRSTAEPPPRAPSPAPTPATPTPAPRPPQPIIEPPLGRADLIQAAAAAADAFAAGLPLPASLRGLVGREFTLRIPFGCPGAAAATASGLNARYDLAEQALRLRAEPVRWPVAAWLPAPDSASAEAPSVETIEGFQIARPWTASETCPVVAAPTTALAAIAPTPQAEPSSPPPPAPTTPPMTPPALAEMLGIAQFHAAGGSRVGRRDGQPFAAVERIAPEALNASRGYRLRLHGRIAPMPGSGAPIRCRSEAGPAQRPSCLIAVILDEVAFENPADGSTIATWDVASPDARSTAARPGGPTGSR